MNSNDVKKFIKKLNANEIIHMDWGMWYSMVMAIAYEELNKDEIVLKEKYEEIIFDNLGNAVGVKKYPAGIYKRPKKGMADGRALDDANYTQIAIIKAYELLRKWTKHATSGIISSMSYIGDMHPRIARALQLYTKREEYFFPYKVEKPSKQPKKQPDKQPS